jgi:hypothetical protein
MSLYHFVKRAIYTLQLAVFAGGVAHGANEWTRLESRQLEVITDATHGTRMDLLRRTAVIHAAATQVLGNVSIRRPLAIIAFSSQNDYNAYKLDAFASAYFLSSWSTDYIVLGGKTSSFWSAFQHEYTHYLIHQRFPTIPLWLDEGLAVALSTTTMEGDKMTIGLAPKDNRRFLERYGLAYAVTTMFALDSRDIALKSHHELGAFYSECWLIAHMLCFSPQYRAKVIDFVTQVSEGKSPVQVITDLWAKSLPRFGSDLYRYRDEGYTARVERGITLDCSLPQEEERISPTALQAMMRRILPGGTIKNNNAR